ncbi:PTS fructose transporter subunit IIB [Sporolactobacillus sp. KGMB 08714]|uniref:PTS fructose transporter subunit IIB n=1 Tax=Sporolactobacillus sp. KGMB 08714 TaxID=3064704 RepID=UPI002FBECB61
MSKMKIIGITACTAGIAHTYMAQSALQDAARKAGYDCKIETQGAMGAENELSAADIAAADVVIIGADIGVEGRDRFEGKPIYETSVSSCVTDPKKIVSEAIKLI